MSEYSHYDHIHMPLTIERQLMAYKNHPDHDFQHEVLWTTWCHNKRMLEQLLRWTLVSFPMYSRHDESHSTSVLRNMERVLGETRIKQLSATDCFALLHVAYEHDIGMCITDADRERIISDPEFVNMLDRLAHGTDQMLASYAKLVKTSCSDIVQPEVNLTEREKCERALKKSLKIYHAMTELLTMFQRSEHGQIAQRRIQDTLASPKSRFSEQFCVSDISPRIFYWIAECAALHTVWEFDKILELPFEDDGAASDKMHPRFIAVMLQLGDALDMDCGRFPLLMEEFSGQLSNETKKHLKKHESIRMLCINDRKIEVRADCEDHSVSRLIQAECRGIDQILRNASYHWSEIAPENVPGMLPSFELSEMTVQGTKIPPQLINASFRISQKKAFSLLEGSNIYTHKLVFLREILQNAYDASKLQYWKDFLGLPAPQNRLSGSAHPPICKGNEMLFSAAEQLSLNNYPVVVKLTVCAITDENSYKAPATAIEAGEIMRDFGSLHYHPSACGGDGRKGKIMRDSGGPRYHDFGIRVEVQDSGIGIGETDLSYIANLGTESEEKRQLKESMPDVLCPTGSFGIGLQSIFLAADHFHMRTRTRTGEAYDIRFSSMTGSEDGIINTTNLPNAFSYPFGTTVTVNVSSKQKNTDPSIFEEARVSYDPFVATEAEKRLHEAEELLVQMVMYLNEILGERLFPLHVQLENLFSDQQHPWLSRMLDNSQKLNFKLTYTLRNPLDRTDITTYSTPDASLSWALCPKFQAKQNCSHGRLENGDRYWFDLQRGKLHIWCNEVGAFATFSASRFCKAVGPQKNGAEYREVPLYYKGIKMSDAVSFVRNLDLLEFVDLKSKHTADILQLNRYYLTEEGKAFFSQTVSSAVMQTVRRVYLHLAGDPYERSPEGKDQNGLFLEIYKELERSIQKGCDLDALPSPEQIQENSAKVTSIILLLFLGKMLLHSDLVVDFQTCGAGVVQSIENCPWDQALKNAHVLLFDSIIGGTDLRIQLQRLYALQRNFPYLFFRVDSWSDSGLRDSGRLITLAELFSSSYKYAVFTLRDYSEQNDAEYRILRFDEEFKNDQEFEDQVNKASNSAKQVFTSQNRADNRNPEDFLYRGNLAAWLVQNIPTAQFYTQHFTPDSANVKQLKYLNYWYEFRVLQVSSVQSIKTDSMTRYRLLEKMLSQCPKQGNIRFVSSIWSEEFYCLSLPQKAVESFCAIYPEPLPAYATPKMLIPFDAEQLKILMNQNMEEILGKAIDASHCQEPPDSDVKTYENKVQPFQKSRTYFEQARKDFIINLSPSQRLALDDWHNNLQKIVWIRFPYESLLCDFLKSVPEDDQEIEPFCDIEDLSTQTFQRFLKKISESFSEYSQKQSKDHLQTFETALDGLPVLEEEELNLFFSEKENVKRFVRAFCFGEELLKWILSEAFMEQHEEKIKNWRGLPETNRLASYVSEHSIHRISRETAHALNEKLYREIISLAAFHRSELYLNAASG